MSYKREQSPVGGEPNADLFAAKYRPSRRTESSRREKRAAGPRKELESWTQT
jgi:hypothetical protein